MPLDPLYNPDGDQTTTLSHFTTQQNVQDHETTYYFDQLIDHFHPEKGTFKQRYWHSDEYYKSGGPVVLFTPGEQKADGFTSRLDKSTMSGAFAHALNGSGVVIEHRFFGESNPYPDLSSESLLVHTVEQAIEDMVYFARNVKLPQPGGDKLAPGNTAWIMVGCSYPGALTSFLVDRHPDVFWAGYAASAVVQSIANFWGYSDAIRQNTPANCSADIAAAINYVDSVLENNDTAEVHAVKANFGLQEVVHVDDFVAALKSPLNYYQSNHTLYEQFCDALEVDDDGSVAPASGFGQEHAFKAMGKYWKETYYPRCMSSLGTHNASSTRWNNTAAPNSGRSWKWLQCRNFGFFPVGAPEGYPSFVSRFLKLDHSERSCEYDFPGALHGTLRSPVLNALKVNSDHNGWNTTRPHLIFANGWRDPWRQATVAADGVQASHSDKQLRLIADGAHCSDSFITHSNKQIEALQQTAIQRMVDWFVEDFGWVH
ncbi:peptidase S28 [Epithele typhae]|uniref:peptidase S28 n=1 Tax=Epithele typhae TaxID=378194 RepID=UPI00200806B4|nr:peptidase S28 [Epithele typhae]KAH9936837.1 peptidase S28 [Epithele typhae]